MKAPPVHVSQPTVERVDNGNLNHPTRATATHAVFITDEWFKKSVGNLVTPLTRERMPGKAAVVRGRASAHQ